MIIENRLLAALGPLAANRAYPLVFPQEKVPTWPAIRFTIVSLNPKKTVCGGTSDDGAIYRVQVDVVTDKNMGGYTAARALRLQVLAAMKAEFGARATQDGYQEQFDPQTKTVLLALDFIVSTSSPAR